MTMKELELIPSERLVLVSLFHFMDSKGKGARPSLKRLEDMTGFSRRTVQRILGTLDKKGLITRTQNPGRGVSYTITSDTMTRVATSWHPGGDTATPRGRHHDAGGGDTVTPDHTHKIIPKDLKERKPTAQKTRSALSLLLDEKIPEQIAQDFLELRKKHKAPLTVTGLKGIKKEADKANLDLTAALEICCARGWRGFKAEWLDKSEKGKPPPEAEDNTIPAPTEIVDRNGDRVTMEWKGTKDTGYWIETGRKRL